MRTAAEGTLSLIHRCAVEGRDASRNQVGRCYVVVAKLKHNAVFLILVPRQIWEQAVPQLTDQKLQGITHKILQAVFCTLDQVVI